MAIQPGEMMDMKGIMEEDSCGLKRLTVVAELRAALGGDRDDTRTAAALPNEFQWDEVYRRRGQRHGAHGRHAPPSSVENDESNW